MSFPNDGKKWTAEEDARVVRALVAVTLGFAWPLAGHFFMFAFGSA